MPPDLDPVKCTAAPFVRFPGRIVVVKKLRLPTIVMVPADSVSADAISNAAYFFVAKTESVPDTRTLSSTRLAPIESDDVIPYSTM